MKHLRSSSSSSSSSSILLYLCYCPHSMHFNDETPTLHTDRSTISKALSWTSANKECLSLLSAHVCVGGLHVCGGGRWACPVGVSSPRLSITAACGLSVGGLHVCRGGRWACPVGVSTAVNHSCVWPVCRWTTCLQRWSVGVSTAVSHSCLWPVCRWTTCLQR